MMDHLFFLGRKYSADVAIVSDGEAVAAASIAWQPDKPGELRHLARIALSLTDYDRQSAITFSPARL